MNKTTALLENALKNGASLESNDGTVSLSCGTTGKYQVSVSWQEDDIYQGSSLFEALSAYDKACFDDEE